MRNPYRGLVVWVLPQLIEFHVTLFHDEHSEIYQDKEWSILIEDVAVNGKQKQVASASINISKYADGLIDGLVQHEIVKFPLNCLIKNVKQAYLTLTLTCQFINSGNETYVLLQSAVYYVMHYFIK